MADIKAEGFASTLVNEIRILNNLATLVKCPEINKIKFNKECKGLFLGGENSNEKWRIAGETAVLQARLWILQSVMTVSQQYDDAEKTFLHNDFTAPRTKQM